jgi:multidrug resistance efflux pump
MFWSKHCDFANRPEPALDSRLARLVQAYNTPYPFTISDLSSAWVLCDVYENDLANVRLGDTAEIRLNADPDRMFKGRVSNNRLDSRS